MLIDAVKEHDGKLEYLYIDIDKHQNIAQMLRVSKSSVSMQGTYSFKRDNPLNKLKWSYLSNHLSLATPLTHFPCLIDPTRTRRLPRS